MYAYLYFVLILEIYMYLHDVATYSICLAQLLNNHQNLQARVHLLFKSLTPFNLKIN